MEEKKTSIYNGYCITWNKASLDKRIKNELGLLNIISSLCAKTGYCFASNDYLANLFQETTQSISNKIKHLEQCDYIEIEYERKGCEIINRSIRLKNYYIDDIKNFIPTIEKVFKDKNISNKNINNKNNSSSNTIFDFIEINFGRTLNPIEYEVISKWEDNELTRYAIKQAVLNNKYNIKYINTILNNYKLNHITNVAEAEEQEGKFKNRYVAKKKNGLEEFLNEQERI